jgi:serine/alanine adding enzyme
MNLKVVTDYNSIEIDKWESFVKNHPDGNIFQTPEMYRVFKSEKYYNPVIVVCYNDFMEIVGLLLSVIQREYKGILGKLSSRSIIWGGPLIKNNNCEILDIILKEYNKLIKGQAIYTQIRNLWNINYYKDIFISNGYKYDDHLNILVDLSKSEEDLWKEVYQKRRNQIKNSVKKGVTIKNIDEVKLVDSSYEILSEVYKSAKLPLQGKDFFIRAKEILEEKGYVKYFGAFLEGKLIGMMYILTFNYRAYEWYIGCLKEYTKINPNDLIIWEAIKWCQKNHLKIYDFGGAGKPDKEYGVRDFKKKFGGETVNLGRYQKVHNRIMMIISIIGFKFWQMIKFK